MEWLICSGDACTWNGVSFHPLPGTSMKLSPSGEKSLSFFQLTERRDVKKCDQAIQGVFFFSPTAWYNLTGRLSRFCLSQYHCSPATTVSLYHLKLSSCPRKHSPRHLRCESRRAMGRDDMTSKPGWSTDTMEFVSWQLSVWTGECTWKPPNLTLSLLQLPSYLGVSHSLKYDQLCLSNWKHTPTSSHFIYKYHFHKKMDTVWRTRETCSLWMSVSDRFFF